MVCCSNGMQPRSSSPWLMISLNSWKRSFSCCCWMGDRCSGTGGWRRGLEAAGGGGESVMATISRVPTFWPACRRRGSGRWLWIATHTSEPLESAGLRTQTLAELPLGRSRHPRWDRDYDSGPVERFRRGCRWFGAVMHGWWGEDPVSERR